MKSLLFCIIALLCCCLGFSQNEITIRINPENARGGIATQIFDTIRFVPLETTPESIFGTIDQLEVTDSFFVILDIQSRSVLIFNRNGSFHHRIKTNGSDNLFGYFALDRKENKIFISNNYANGLLVYDFNGRLVKKINREENIRSVFMLNNNTLLLNLRRYPNLKPNSANPFDIVLYPINRDTLIYRNRFDPAFETEEYNIESNPINFSGEPGSAMFSLPFDYKVFQFNDTGIIRTYKFVFPANLSLPIDFSTSPSFKDTRGKFVYSTSENRIKIREIRSTYRLNNYLLFSAPNGVLRIGADLHYLYNMKTGTLISFSKVTSDSTSSYIPILSSVFEPIGSIFNDKIFSSVASFRIFGIKGQISNPIIYPASLKDYIEKGSKNNNPVIVELAIKSNL